MYMKELKAIQERLDQADFYLLESLMGKTDEEVVAVLERELRAKHLQLTIGKAPDEVNKRIGVINDVIAMRFLTKSLREMDKMNEAGIPVVGGVTIA